VLFEARQKLALAISVGCQKIAVVSDRFFCENEINDWTFHNNLSRDVEIACRSQDSCCPLGQGYLWARPMPANEFQQLLQNGLDSAK
jgi:hypothetical protein